MNERGQDGVEIDEAGEQSRPQSCSVIVRGAQDEEQFVDLRCLWLSM